MAKNEVIVTRAGGVWEAVGFVLVSAGVVTGLATLPDNHVGAVVGVIGLVVFLIGRFK